MLPFAVILCLAGAGMAIGRQDWPAVAGWLAAAAGLAGLWIFLMRIEDLVHQLTHRFGVRRKWIDQLRREGWSWPPIGAAGDVDSDPTILPFRRPPA